MKRKIPTKNQEEIAKSYIDAGYKNVAYDINGRYVLLIYPDGIVEYIYKKCRSEINIEKKQRAIEVYKAWLLKNHM